MNSTFRFGVWSLGAHALKNILPSILESKSASLHGVYSRNATVRRSVAAQYTCRNYMSSDEMLEDPEIDAVYISSPNSEHFEQILACLNAGKSVICEKAAVLNRSDAQVIVEVAKNKGLLVMEAFMYRFHEQFLSLKRLLDSQKYGEILSVRAQFGFPHLEGNNIRYLPELAGGALNDAGAYTISAARYLLGDSLRLVSSLNLHDGYPVDVRGAALFEQSGGKAIAQCSWAFGGSYVNEIEVWCADARISVERAFSKPESLETTIVVRANGATVEELLTGKDNHFCNMIESFCKCLSARSIAQELEHLKRQACLLDAVRGGW